MPYHNEKYYKDNIDNMLIFVVEHVDDRFMLKTLSKYYLFTYQKIV